MTTLANAAVPLVAEVLLAARNLGAAGRYRVQEADAGAMLLWMMVAACGIAVVSMAIYYGSRIRHRRRHSSPILLFHGLCRLHGLDRDSQRLLRQVARHHRLPNPLRLFTEPKWLDPTALGEGLSGRANEVSSLRKQLFA